MREEFQEIIQQAEQGNEIFKKMFDCRELNTNDTFLLVLTDNDECIRYGAKYLLDFKELYCRSKVYILLDKDIYITAFEEAGGDVRLCKRNELQYLARYFNVFHKKEESDKRIIFLTEKNGYSLAIEDLLGKNEFSMEEYVAISLYQLRQLKGNDICMK